MSASLLFIEPFEKVVIDMTNLEGIRHYKDKSLNVDTITMRAYYGLLLLAGFYRSNGECIEELWDDKRYKQINRCVRFDNRETREQESDKLAPIRLIFDKWVQRLQQLYITGDFITVDEMLLPLCEGGMKIWVAADANNFYAHNLQVGPRVVLDMMQGLNGRTVTCDNFFTSRSLTISKNREEIPPILLDMKKRPIYHTEFVFDHDLGASMLLFVSKKGLSHYSPNVTITMLPCQSSHRHKI